MTKEYEQTKGRDMYKCLGCGKCMEICEFGCFDLINGDDFAMCGSCGQCLEVCPVDAISM